MTRKQIKLKKIGNTHIVKFVTAVVRFGTDIISSITATFDRTSLDISDNVHL